MTRRWRLFPKYALLIITLVGSMLLASGAIGTYFSWRENERNLLALQQEKARNAAHRIDEFVGDIVHELSWTALPSAQGGGDPLEQRRVEYLKLQRQAPAITEVAWIDAEGREQLRISRLAMDAIASGVDLSRSDAFRVGSAGTYYGPVYFRKGSEPYMTIARPAGGGGVTAAEVNLKFVWDVVKDIRIGGSGLAWVVDENGTLVAHPDISLVLRKSDLSALPQVAALRAGAANAAERVDPVNTVNAAERVGSANTENAVKARDLQGEEVLSAHATIPTLRWTVFVESPRAEAFAPLYATLQRTSLLLVAALLISIAAGFFLARALVRPLRALEEGAAQIGAGDLERRIEVRTGDELEGLAEQFNRMSAQLRESYAGLERKVEQRTAELSEALEYQTATAEILKVISSSPTDVAPVLEAVADRSRLLCRAHGSRVWLLEGERLRAVAGSGRDDDAGAAREAEVVPALPTSVVGRAFVERRTLHVDDIVPLIPAPFADSRDLHARQGYRTVLAVPMLREGEPVGIIAVMRQQVQPFSDGEIRLVETFADQALIAIENVRLFNETREALERQTATAEVLRVISGSVADSAPVFEKILESCDRLFSSNEQGIVLLGDDGRLHLGAHRGSARERLAPLFPAARALGEDPVILGDQVRHFRDVLDAGVPEMIRRVAQLVDIGSYSQVIAPMVWQGAPIGSIYVIRQPPVGFSAKEIELLRTFADQAVIAIQNARLFNETKEALAQQTATGEVLQVISSSVADTQPVFDKILDSCERLFAATSLGIYLVDDDGILHKAGFRALRDKPERALAGKLPRPLAGTSTEIAIRERRVVHFPDVLAAADAPEPLRRIAEAVGSFSIAFAPMLWEGRGVGAIQVARDPPAPFSDKELGLLKTFADQTVIAIQNARLFTEIEAKRGELERANKHKSEFLANMSHELRTPLNAIIGFSEVLSEQMFGEVNDKQLEYLRDIHSSGHHLLSLINDILDLSKIEAGRMELDLQATNLPMLLDNCTTLVRERASRNGLVLSLDVDEALGDWVADVRKLKQIVINLLSNAVKFTPPGGRVTLRARRLEHAVEIAVVDTGVGIAADQQALVFEEFRQAGGDYLRKSEGTGLGLSLARRFVELHGGTIRVESEPGRGSTFAFILPERMLEAV
jgi:signal transduction histidine kinase